MAVIAKSRSSLHKDKCDFNKIVLKKILYLVVFSCINLPLTAKYTSGKLYSNCKLAKDRKTNWFVVLGKELK